METVIAQPMVKIREDIGTEVVVRERGNMLRGYGFDLNENVAAAEVSERVSEVLRGGEEEIRSEGDESAKVMINEDEPELVRAPPTSSGLSREDSMELLFPIKKEKPPVSSRFGHRKAAKAIPEAKPLGVAKSKRNDTLENTWKTITEGRSMPLSRHLKKSDTWEIHSRINPPVNQNTPPTMNKSETFTDRKSTTASQGSGKLRKEPSLSQDELNRRVEAFIRKFNEEMRLQRLASLNQYQETIATGAY